MGLVPIATTPSATGSKTKAKQRYLKAKKDRKKHKKAAEPQKPLQATIDNDKATPQDLDDEADSEPDLVLPVPTPEATPAKEKRIKKKRKLAGAEDVDMTEEVPPPPEPEVQSDEIVLDEAPAAPLDPRSVEENPAPPIQPSLPSFPLPSQPEPPAPSVLYLQGLDQALIEAEIVDPIKVFPLSDESNHHGLSPKTRARLEKLGITELFAVQNALLPFLLPGSPDRHLSYSPYDPPRDVCVSAPTGSGKTLAYVLPILETLSSRIVTRLRALIVLPTRDLVSQVRETFEEVCKGRGLKIGIATGQHSFAQEQVQLVGDQSSPLQGGLSKVDILICTPGRLIDHLNGTPNFTLQHLRFLVIDEADRLVTQAFQDWLAQVLAATRPPSGELERAVLNGSGNVLPSIPRHDAVASTWLPYTHFTDYIRTDVDEKKESYCQKLLFSATLTRDPSKIAALDLRDAKYFVVGGSDLGGEENTVASETFAFPATLKEHMIVCSSLQKPLMLLYLMHKHSVTNALVFTKSAESTTRLVKLIEFFEASWAAESPPIDTDEPPRKAIVARAYSSDLSAGERKGVLETFKNGQIGILVCSDLISRGMDISHVSHVVSYDSPVDLRKYVHRVGRTARAGRAGEAWSLVEEQEARFFKQMMSAANHLDQVAKVKVPETALKPFSPHYEAALTKLKGVYGRNQ